MNISGIITEYNPLHKGHVHHIQETKRITNCDALVCVMSGNFVQRGLPAMIDKWQRTDMALNNGIDLVIELPVLYSLSSAEFFAFGAVSLLNSLGAVSSLCFGSESGAIDSLYHIAEVLATEPIAFQILLKENLKKGLAFPKARSEALAQYFKENQISHFSLELEELLNASNNILGIEYCKSLIKLKSKIKAFTIKRQGGQYTSDEFDMKFSSATSIRKFIYDEKKIAELDSHLPKSTFDLISALHKDKYPFVFENALFNYIKYKCYTYGNFEALPDVSEGIHNKIHKALLTSNTFSELIDKSKSKRYTYTRINRILCQYFVGFDSFPCEKLRKEPASYGRILGFTDKGIKALKCFKENSSIPLYTKMPKSPSPALALDLQSTKAYSLLNHTISPQSDYLISPIYKRG